MTLRIAVLDKRSAAQRLAELLSPEFQVDVYYPALDDPMLFGPRCRIEGCEGNRVLRAGICNSHMGRAVRRRGEQLDSSKTNQRLSMKNQSEWLDHFVATPALHGGPITYNHAGFRFDGLPKSLADELRLYLHAIRVEHTFVARLPEFMCIYRAAVAVNPMPLSLFDQPYQEAMAYLRSRTELPLPGWLSQYQGDGRVVPTIRFIKQQVVRACYDLPRMERDVWELEDFGLSPKYGSNNSCITFSRIQRPWLREWVKRYAEYRLRVGIWFSSVRAEVNFWQRIDALMNDWNGPLNSPSDVTRPLLEFLLERINCSDDFGNHSKTGALSAIRKLLQAHRDLDWSPPLAQSAVIRRNEAADPERSMPNPVDPFILAQLLNPTNLNQMQPQLANGIVIGRHHGLRVSSLLTLMFNPIRYTENGAVLMYFNTKLNRKAEQPIMKQDVLDAIKRQQDWVLSNYSKGSKWLFPAVVMNFDGDKPWNSETLHLWFQRAIRNLKITDRNGEIPLLTWHQFRDTFATELLEAGVAPYVVAAMLDHRDTWSLDAYARQSANAMRRYLEQTPRFDQAGEELSSLNESKNISEAEFMRDSLRLVSGTVPNGYCTLPIREDCPHMNACYTCPSASYITTPDNLPGHLKHLEETQMLIVANEANGQTRMAQKNRVTEQHVIRIMNVLLDWVEHHPQEIRETVLENFLLRNEQQLKVIRTIDLGVGVHYQKSE